MTIGQVAKKAQVTAETIRYYERLELLPAPPRNRAGYRQYSLCDVRRIQLIKRAQHLRFTLQEIKELLSLRANPQATGGDIKKRVAVKIADVKEQIRALQRVKKTLETLAAVCDERSPASECLILKALESEPE